MKERRKGVRAIAFFRTEVIHEKKIYAGYIVNISAVGCAFAHENLSDLELGTEVKIKFRLDGRTLNQAAEVRWRDATLMGLKFKGLTASASKTLRNYIRAVTLRRIPL